jgi:1,4-dihydroxy-2-naphthoate octaprenyltransferase
LPAVLCLLFALIMQIDANLVNDFVDYAKGTDDRETRLGPERACAQGWVSIERMKKAIAATTCLACVVGLPLAWYGGLEMILIGMLCVVFCFLYTTHLSYQGLGDVLVLLFFGLVPVAITYYIQLHTITVEVVVAALACGLVIDALLLVNNFRDRDTDREAGKQTLVVRTGPKTALFCYVGVGVVACLMGGYFAWQGRWWAFVLPVVYLVLHLLTAVRMKRIWQGRELNRCLGMTARNILIYGLTVTVGVLLSVV